MMSCSDLPGHKMDREPSRHQRADMERQGQWPQYQGQRKLSNESTRLYWASVGVGTLTRRHIVTCYAARNIRKNTHATLNVSASSKYKFYPLYNRFWALYRWEIKYLSVRILIYSPKVLGRRSVAVLYPLRRRCLSTSYLRLPHECILEHLPG